MQNLKGNVGSMGKLLLESCNQVLPVIKCCCFQMKVLAEVISTLSLIWE